MSDTLDRVDDLVGAIHDLKELGAALAQVTVILVGHVPAGLDLEGGLLVRSGRLGHPGRQDSLRVEFERKVPRACLVGLNRQERVVLAGTPRGFRPLDLLLPRDYLGRLFTCGTCGHDAASHDVILTACAGLQGTNRCPCDAWGPVPVLALSA